MLEGIMDFAAGILKKEILKDVDMMMKRSMRRMAFMVKEILPAIIFSIIFYVVGVIVAALGLGRLIDFYLNMNGAGFLIMGIVLILLGFYYQRKATGFMKRRMRSRMELEREYEDEFL